MNKVIIGILFVALLVISGCQTQKPFITVAEEDQACRVDEDCTGVPTRCDSCENYAPPVNKAHKEEYEQKLLSYCGQAGILPNESCRSRPLNPHEYKCINNQCQYAEPELRKEVLDLFSCKVDTDCVLQKNKGLPEGCFNKDKLDLTKDERYKRLLGCREVPTAYAMVAFEWFCPVDNYIVNCSCSRDMASKDKCSTTRCHKQGCVDGGLYVELYKYESTSEGAILKGEFAKNK